MTQQHTQKENSPIRGRSRLVNENYLTFLYEAYLAGNFISDEQFDLLKDNGYIKDKLPRKPYKKQQRKTKRDFTVSHKSESEVDKLIEIEEWNDDEEEVIEVGVEEQSEPFKIRKGGTITKKDWMPTSIVYHNKDFVDWIDSINSSFKSKKQYAKYNLYVQQAEDWYAENGSITNYQNYSEKIEYCFQEIGRCQQNALYFANKYGFMEDSTVTGGKVKYFANEHYEHQRVLCYLTDCGYSFILGKPRQVGGTVIQGLIALRDILTMPNYFVKFITKDVKKASEILDSKIKYPMGQLPDWFRPNGDEGSVILNETDTYFRIGKKVKGGDDKGLNTRIEIVAPTKTAVNGGTPSKVLIDEAADVVGLTEMLNEARPTMFRKNIDNTLEQVRQVIMWSTGTSLNAGIDFEMEWNKIMYLWKERKFGLGFIPLFFDWTTRCDEKEYNRQKDTYYGGNIDGKDVSVDKGRYMFHQHYPSSPADMFKTYDSTLISKDIIDKNVNKIKESDLPPVQFGYFEPIFDTSVVMGENSDVPFKIIGAEWKPCEETDDRVTTVIFQHPKKGWVNRYYQGTDPIASDTGSSKMASGVWDERYKTLSAVTNIRVQNDTDYNFLQTTLLGIYYGFGKPIKELVERNIGAMYVKYKENKGFLSSLVLNVELEDYLQSGGSFDVGIDNKANRNRIIINKMEEVAISYGERIYIQQYWEQHRTFVSKVGKSGKTTWGVKDTRIFDDDILFATTYAYMCAECFNSRLFPRNVEEEVGKGKQRVRELTYDSNFNLIYKDTYK